MEHEFSSTNMQLSRLLASFRFSLVLSQSQLLFTVVAATAVVSSVEPITIARDFPFVSTVLEVARPDSSA